VVLKPPAPITAAETEASRKAREESSRKAREDFGTRGPGGH
jgi:hypothetical protein